MPDWLNELVGWLEAGAKYAIYLALMMLFAIMSDINELREETRALDRRIMSLEIREGLVETLSVAKSDPG